MPSRGPSVHTVKSLSQARILADPLRLSILREFVEQPRTTMQVAERLGEKAPKLYRHVQALLDAGLLVRKGERQKRGTTERYLQAVASRFEVDASLFAPAAPGRASASTRELANFIRTLFASTQSELLASCETPAAGEGEPTVARLYVSGSRKEVESIRRKILAVLESAGKTKSKARSAKSEVTMSGLIAFHVSERK
jgi:DNA-binding transcriptional ArsR family regulator